MPADTDLVWVKGNALKELREKRQWSREELATQSITSSRTVMRAETNQGQTQFAKALAWATALNVSVDELIDISKENKKLTVELTLNDSTGQEVPHLIKDLFTTLDDIVGDYAVVAITYGSLIIRLKMGGQEYQLLQSAFEGGDLEPLTK